MDIIVSRRKKQSVCHCINLRRAATAVTDYYDRILKPAGLTINQYSLLINIARNQPLSVSALSAAVGLERTTLTRSLQPLFRAGLIIDQAQAGSRERQLHLSPHGSRLLKSAAPLWEQAQAGIETALGAGGLKKLNSFLFLLETMQPSK